MHIYMHMCAYMYLCGRICVIRSVFKCPVAKMEVIKAVNSLNIPAEQLLAGIPSFLLKFDSKPSPTVVFFFFVCFCL